MSSCKREWSCGSEWLWLALLSLFLNPAVGKSCEKMKQQMIDVKFLHLNCSPVVGYCDTSRSQSENACVKFRLRISVSVLTSRASRVKRRMIPLSKVFPHKAYRGLWLLVFRDYLKKKNYYCKAILSSTLCLTKYLQQIIHHVSAWRMTVKGKALEGQW